MGTFVSVLLKLWFKKVIMGKISYELRLWDDRSLYKAIAISEFDGEKVSRSNGLIRRF